MKFILSHSKRVLSFITNRKCLSHEIEILKRLFKFMVQNFVLHCLPAKKFQKIRPGIRPLKRHTISQFCHNNRPFLRKVLILIKCLMGAASKLGKSINQACLSKFFQQKEPVCLVYFYTLYKRWRMHINTMHCGVQSFKKANKRF